MALTMRRLVVIAAFALLMAIPVWAQRGGGHAGGGHIGGGGMHGGGFASHAGGSHFGGMRSGAVRSGPGFSRGFNHSLNRGFHQGSFRGRFHDHGFHSTHHHFNNFVLRNNCYGFGCWNRWGWGYPWWTGYYDPWWYDDDRQFDEDYDRQYEIANEMNQQSLDQQRMWRQEEADGDQDSYAPRSHHPAAQSGESQPDPPSAPTVLVFRDQHRQDIQNYAIVGQTLWSFSSGRTQKIPLADLDVAATEKANDDRGVTFRVPGTNPGQ